MGPLKSLCGALAGNVETLGGRCALTGRAGMWFCASPHKKKCDVQRYPLNQSCPSSGWRLGETSLGCPSPGLLVSVRGFSSNSCDLPFAKQERDRREVLAPLLQQCPGKAESVFSGMKGTAELHFPPPPAPGASELRTRLIANKSGELCNR